jgi:Mrp family chromosome partitioning ATPase/capsular polysaccharide biosynthesis protein
MSDRSAAGTAPHEHASPATGRRGLTLHDYLQVARRRKWTIVFAVVLVQFLAMLLTLSETPSYQATAQDMLSRQSLADSLNGLQDPTVSAQPDWFPQTQADLARSPAVARRVLAQLRVRNLTVQQFLASSSVAPAADADVLTFEAHNANPALAMRMASEYASQYRSFRLAFDTQAIRTAREQLQRRIEALPSREGALHANLVERDQQLSTMEALLTSQVAVIGTPSSAPQVSPRPLRNAAFALVLGLLLGVGLAFLREALDTRVRTGSEVGERLQLPLLARIPEPAPQLAGQDKLAMLVDPSGSQAEAFRMLRTNLEFATLGLEVRSMLITSAFEREGKSTTIANLAVALARGGRNVVLVDLDLRRPYLDRFFALQGRPGVTQVALGHVPLLEALVDVPITPIAPGRHVADRYDLSRNGTTGVNGRLKVLGSGPIPPDPGEFVASNAVSHVLEQLRELADVVLVDAPPLLPVGDALVLSAKVDGLILATRMETVRRPMLDDLRRLLALAPGRKLGFIVTGAEAEEAYGYSRGYGYADGGVYDAHAQPAGRPASQAPAEPEQPHRDRRFVPRAGVPER